MTIADHIVEERDDHCRPLEVGWLWPRGAQGAEIGVDLVTRTQLTQSEAKDKHKQKHSSVVVPFLYQLFEICDKSHGNTFATLPTRKNCPCKKTAAAQVPIASSTKQQLVEQLCNCSCWAIVQLLLHTDLSFQEPLHCALGLSELHLSQTCHLLCVFRWWKLPAGQELCKVAWQEELLWQEICNMLLLPPNCNSHGASSFTLALLFAPRKRKFGEKLFSIQFHSRPESQWRRVATDWRAVTKQFVEE